MKAKILRTMDEPKITFVLQPQRILRGVRIAAKLGYVWSDTAKQTIQSMFNEKNYFSVINPDRLYFEFREFIFSWLCISSLSAINRLKII